MKVYAECRREGCDARGLCNPGRQHGARARCPNCVNLNFEVIRRKDHSLPVLCQHALALIVLIHLPTIFAHPGIPSYSPKAHIALVYLNKSTQLFHQISSKSCCFLS